MKIIYVSTVLPQTTYDKLYSSSRILPSPAAQKYHSLVIKGLESNNIEINTVSLVPETSESDKNFYKVRESSEGNIKYHYIGSSCSSVFHGMILFIKAYRKILKLSADKGSVIICDALLTSMSAAAILVSKLFRRKAVAVVTDLPFMLDKTKSIRTRLTNCIIPYFSGYILMTEAMNNICNPKYKPYMIMEGLVDSSFLTVNNEKFENTQKKICIYAGGLHEKYGIGKLVEAFILTDIKDSELHIYGNGNYQDKLQKICTEHSNIKYMGVQPNKTVVEDELSASLLINPRPSDEDFTKYSFPSKNMEYMVSGTPVLTTKLPGMPEDYYPFVCTFDDESVEGMNNALQKVLNTPAEELREKGRSAQQFVLENKNNIIQTRKIMEYVKNLK
ncbi:MAG: hypothetical protein A2Y15_02280 [Clostridiales bacterium GWF2_36_10]|nr:MAG: hypothetical protein A2Y15_02280 [Clostridiales bacterium GWF2_36_10]HAN21277.1 glycosyl transferase family 1 [Clostridiales bacterium]